ncbi:hypothetical protein AMTRI_Chr12g272280 [Amborella trichopoda]|uniref:uncharacterized protein LOC18421800 n=1 Tax=Amborella trichopoda TaxID=13333 RepID=UPI0009C091E5|nr:uncharacterized protein LOC18421800 [Amborella trichopoda]XP_020518421.1 uncharacterized protein LOC18421800 [Amborella trichopoda]|eukprot:XP_020518418.1 uncharacterized protein LOC18421800 [Amborella trichopoda]
MDSEEESATKRMKTPEETMEEEADLERVIVEETAHAVKGSEEMENSINLILQRMEGFTFKVSELLEAGRTLFRQLSTQFEERIISIHQNQIEIWQEEIKELRVLDAANEEASGRLHGAQCLLHSAGINS